MKVVQEVDSTGTNSGKKKVLVFGPDLFTEPYECHYRHEGKN